MIIYVMRMSYKEKLTYERERFSPERKLYGERESRFGRKFFIQFSLIRYSTFLLEIFTL